MRRFSVREIPTSWDVPIRLGMREAELARADRLAEEMEQLLPGQLKAMEEAKRASLTPEQKEALDVPAMERTDAQRAAAQIATQSMRVDWPQVVAEAQGDVRLPAKELLRQWKEAKETAEIIDRYREIVNFDVWRATCEAEVTEPAIKAREATWRAEKDFENAKLQPAKQAYEEAFAAWREVLDASPVLRADSITADDMSEIVDRYRKVLEQLDEPFPKPFILEDMLKLNAWRTGYKSPE